MPAETSQTLDRGLRVLELLAEAPGGLSINELAAAVGVNRTVIYRLVTTLEQHNLARRDSSGRVQGGMGALLLARGVQPMLRDLAGPTLRALAEAVGATAHLTVAEGGEGLAIAVVEPSWTDYHVGYRVGARHPLERGAAGRAILLGRAIAAGQHSSLPGFVASQGELQPGGFGVAAPLPADAGIEASVGVVALSALDAAQVGPGVAAAARELAERLR